MSNEWIEIVDVCNEFKENNYYFSNSELPEDKILDGYSNTLSKFISSIKNFKNYEEYFFCLCGIQAHLYKFYASDDKQLTNIDDKDSFQRYFIESDSLLCQFVFEKHWKFYPDQEFFRKEGDNAKNGIGQYIIKEVPLIARQFTDSDFHNIRRNYSQEEKFANYFWVYGVKFQGFDISSRFYFNFYPNKEAIKDFIYELQLIFDEAQLPFALKFLANPEEYNNRCDVCVLYVSRNQTLAAIMALTRVYLNFKDTKNFFADKKPLFTKKMVPGVSFGEDPDDQRFDSFGAYRCCYLTLSFFELWKENKLIDVKSIQDKINHFQDLDGERNHQNLKRGKWTNVFYINKYSVYYYKKELKYLEKNWENSKNNNVKQNIFLEAAIKIGFKLSSKAFWYCPPKNSTNKQLECNWVGYINKTLDEGILNSINYKVLNNEFIEGKIGVSYFLNRLYFATNKKYKEFDTTHYRSAISYIDGLESKYSSEVNWFLTMTQFSYREPQVRISQSPKFKITNTINFDFIEILNEIINKKNLNIKNIDSPFLDFLKGKLELFLKEDTPLLLVEEGNEFQPSFNLGLSYIGYACLRIYGAQEGLNIFPPVHIEL